MQKLIAVILAQVLLTGLVSARDWSEVAPIFKERCVICHSGEFAPLGLRLDNYNNLMAGSDTGPVVQPGNNVASSLIQRVEGRKLPRMPLDGPPWLGDEQILLLSDWINAGADGPKENAPESPPEAGPDPIPDPMVDGQITYNEISRILAQSCIECHSDNSKMGTPPERLRLDTLANVLAGGDQVVVIPGNAQASEIVRRIAGLSKPRMPFDGPPWLDESQIEMLRAWIDGGAKDNSGQEARIPTGREIRIRGKITGENEIDGVHFVITGATRVDERPGIGRQAELRAHVGPDGGIIADRLRER